MGPHKPRLLVLIRALTSMCLSTSQFLNYREKKRVMRRKGPGHSHTEDLNYTILQQGKTKIPLLRAHLLGSASMPAIPTLVTVAAREASMKRLCNSVDPAMTFLLPFLQMFVSLLKQLPEINCISDCHNNSWSVYTSATLLTIECFHFRTQSIYKGGKRIEDQVRSG